MIRRRVVINGRVMDTVLRQSYLREAQRLGVRGWVLNRDDGQIDGVFEGEPDAVEKMIDWVRVGSAHTYITSITVEDEEPGGEQEFVVR